jgi:glycine/D-amino acid oxidase-like deaminating enzyme/nitrite reductase/ring-hydroxylating ferredoxin subunit
MKPKPFWDNTNIPRFPALKKSTAFDVVVIGGGITGLTAAYLLKQAGKKVCVLERDRLGSGDTGFTTAHLTMVTDLRLKDLVRTFGRDAAQLAWAGGAAAIDTIEGIAAEEDIDCEFRRVPGFLHAALNGDKDESWQLREEANLAAGLGFDAAFVDAVPYLDKPGIRFSNQAKFHPRAYLAGLATSIAGDGSAIFEHSEAGEIQDDPLVVKVGKHEITCGYLVIATHVPLMGKTGLISATLLQTKIFPYSSYVLGAKVPKGLIPEASFWDTADPYYYLRVDRRGTFDYVIFGGEDHKTGQDDPEEHFERLQAMLLELIPRAQVTHRWSGQVIETNDGLPYIGETSDRQFAATGFAGNGMTFGTLAGLMACDAALGRKNPWQPLFDVGRKKVRGGAWHYVKENIDYPYYFVKDRLAGAEGTSTRTLKRGEGKVLELGGQKVACYRDPEGNLSKVSPICTHMGCIVHWNQAEATWDCPCHGSRFRPMGEVLAGPAETPLEAIQPRKRAVAHAGNGKKPSKRKASRPSRLPKRNTASSGLGRRK